MSKRSPISNNCRHVPECTGFGNRKLKIATNVIRHVCCELCKIGRRKNSQLNLFEANLRAHRHDGEESE